MNVQPWQQDWSPPQTAQIYHFLQCHLSFFWDHVLGHPLASHDCKEQNQRCCAVKQLGVQSQKANLSNKSRPSKETPTKRVESESKTSKRTKSTLLISMSSPSQRTFFSPESNEQMYK
jgi:hypothetical protein